MIAEQPERIELCSSCGGPAWERDSRNHRRRHTDCWARTLAQRNDLAAQIDRLAKWIIENVPGEPSQSEGAIDTAIRLLGRR